MKIDFQVSLKRMHDKTGYKNKSYCLTNFQLIQNKENVLKRQKNYINTNMEVSPPPHFFLF